MKLHTSRNLMSAAGVIVGLTMTVGWFAPFAFAQTNGGTGTTTTSTTSTTTNNTATTTNSATSTPVQIMVMKHLCNANIKNYTDFTNIQQGLNQVAAFAKAEANCPTTGLPGNNPMPSTVSAPRTNFDITIMGPNGATSHIASSTFMNEKVCESDFNVDVNNDNSIASSTCLDASHYAYPWIATTTSGQQMVTVTESDVPAGYHFGTILFTPPQLVNNNDAESLVSTTSMNTGEGSIVLNTAHDTDRKIMLHVYNFLDTGSGTTTGTTTNNGGNNGGTGTTTNNGGNNGGTGTTTNNGGGTGTTTGTTTPGFFDFQFNLARLNAIVNILQRVQDIQSRIVDIVASIANGGWSIGGNR